MNRFSPPDLSDPAQARRWLFFDADESVDVPARIAEITTALEAAVADPTTLTDEQIGEYETELLALFDSIRAGEVEGVDARDIEVLQSIGTTVESLRTLAQERITTAEATDAAIAELEASLVAQDDPEDPEGDEGEPPADPEDAEAVADPVEPVVEPVPEPVLAGTTLLPRLGSLRKGAIKTRPRPVEKARSVKIAVDNRQADGMIDVAQGIIDQASMLSTQGKLHVARLTGEYTEDRTLVAGNMADNTRKLNALCEVGREAESWTPEAVTAAGGNPAIVAAGGWCVPGQVDYTEVVVSVDGRPVKAALPSVGADRGSIQVTVSPTLADVDLAGSDAMVGQRTNASDIAGDTKPIQVIACADFATFTLYGVTKRIRFGDWPAAAHPEDVRSWNDLGMAAHARLGEQLLLNAIRDDAGTTNLTIPSVFGTWRDLLESITRAAMVIRSSERAWGARLRVMLPQIVIGMVQADLIRTHRDDPENAHIAEATIRQKLDAIGVNTSFYWDSPTGANQSFGVQTDGGELDDWPGHIQWGLWFEGHFAFMERPAIDISVVRDADLIGTNDFETFYESFEGLLVRRGPQAYWMFQDVCADGTYADAVTDRVDCAS